MKKQMKKIALKKTTVVNLNTTDNKHIEAGRGTSWLEGTCTRPVYGCHLTKK